VRCVRQGSGRPALAGAWDETARLYGRGFSRLVLVALLPAVAVPGLVAFGARHGAAISAAFVVASASLAMLGPGAVIVAASDIRHGRPVSFPRAYLAPLRRLVAIVGAGLILGLALIVPIAIVSAIVVHGQSVDARATIVLLAVAFALSLRFQLVLPAILLGHDGAWSSLGRSWSLLRRSTIRFLPLAVLATCTEVLPSVVEGVRPRGAGWLLAGAVVGAVAMPAGAVGLTVAYERLRERGTRDDVSWIPETERDGFAQVAAARARSEDPERRRRLSWTHLLLLPLVVSIPGLLMGKEWGSALFLLSLPFALSYLLFRGVGRLLRD
jgi:hypothetical protein